MSDILDYHNITPAHIHVSLDSETTGKHSRLFKFTIDKNLDIRIDTPRLTCLTGVRSVTDRLGIFEYMINPDMREFFGMLDRAALGLASRYGTSLGIGNMSDEDITNMYKSIITADDSFETIVYMDKDTMEPNISIFDADKNMIENKCILNDQFEATVLLHIHGIEIFRYNDESPQIMKYKIETEQLLVYSDVPWGCEIIENLPDNTPDEKKIDSKYGNRMFRGNIVPDIQSESDNEDQQKNFLLDE